ncbi:MAG: hypothetical protein ACOYXT_27450 [Bacteroidota bacterium]
MKYIDFTIQTLLLVAALASAITTIMVEAKYFSYLLIVQLLTGVWQLGACVISLLVYRGYHEWKQKYLFWAIIYVCSLMLVPGLFTGVMPEWFKMVFKLYFLIPSWVFAAIYYAITWNGVFPRNKKRGSFLPNVSF